MRAWVLGRFVCLAIAAASTLLLTGCLAMVPDDMAVIGYHDVKDRAGFWIREWERAGDEAGVDFRGAPDEVKRCAGEEMVKISPPDLNMALDRFLTNQNAGNYKAMLPLVRRFSSGYEDAYGVQPGTRVGQICAERLRQAQT